MSESRLAQLKAGIAAWNRHDAEGVSARFAADALLRVMATGEEARGREQIQALVAARIRAVPDWRLELRRTYDGGETLCAEWRLTGTHQDEFMGIPATHRAVDMVGCSIFAFDPSGLATEERVYFDAATLLHHLGLLPEPQPT